MLQLLSRVVRAAALVALALFFALALPPAISRAAYWTYRASTAGDAIEVRRQVLGDAWVDGIDRARRLIPADGSYFLVNGEHVMGCAYWVRYELAPRRARFVGVLPRLPRDASLRTLLTGDESWVVIAYREPRPPLLLRREEFLRSMEQPVAP